MKLTTKINLVLSSVFALAFVAMALMVYVQAGTMASETFYSILILIGVLFAVLIIAINIMIHKLVLVPVSRVTRLADEASKGNLRAPEVKVCGQDELAELTLAFNRMRRSKIKIVQLLRKAKAASGAES